MNYGEIKKYDIANGEGVRVSLFVSGCTHHCKNCFNYETWDFSYGKLFTEDTENEIIEDMNHEFIDGLSLLGGEPFEPSNQRVLTPFLKKLKGIYPHKNIWCYTGYLFDEELLGDSRARCETTDEMLSYIDVLVDGKFVEALKNISLAYKGSENQRIIDVKESLRSGNVEIWRSGSARSAEALRAIRN